MKNWNSFSLKTRVTVIFSVLSLSYLTVGFVLQQKMVQKWEQNEMEAFQESGKSFGKAIAAQFYERYGDIQAIASNGNLLSKDAAVRTSTLNTYVGLYGIYDLFLFLDTKGNVISASDVDPSGKKIETNKIANKNFADQDWFQSALKGVFTEDKDKGFTGTLVQDPQLDSITSEVYGQKMYGNSFTTTVKDAAGAVVGVISARAGFRWAEYDAELAYKSLISMGNADAEVILINKNGEKLIDISKKTFDPKNGYQRNLDVLRSERVDYYSKDTIDEINTSKSAIRYSENIKNHETDLVAYGPVTDPKKFFDAVGWKVVFVSDEESVVGVALHARNMFVATFFGLGVLGLFFGYRFSTGLSKRLDRMAKDIELAATQVNEGGDKISNTSNSLSSSTHEQAAAVQETVAAIDEVSAMVSKSADNAKDSLAVATASQVAAEKGKEAIDAMLGSINDIQESNTTIMKQIDQSNQEITSIVTLINEIGQKTKVINDIVFQTKLLSFNASVEAARAGEHGKGFAVVAEEVGNLAQMSGNAAKEITQMLDNSTKQVAQIAENTKTKVSGLMDQNHQKVNLGSENAKKCAEVLNEIVKNVNRAGQMASEIASEIASASKEQNQGVMEITKAMNQLSIVSQDNATSSQEASSASTQLMAKAEELHQIVYSLIAEVRGNQSGNVGVAKVLTASTRHASAKPGALPSNVLKLTPKETVKTPTKQVYEKERKVVGANPIPSADDPRFEDV